MEHIFKTKPDNVAEMYFCLKGNEDFVDENSRSRISDPNSKNVAAKCTQNKKPKHFDSASQYYRYYIKVSPTGEVYNPIQYLGSFKDKKHNIVNQVCKTEWAFKEVNKNLFDKYIQFLNTANISWLREVERDTK
jgi:hypothetical protein